MTEPTATPTPSAPNDPPGSSSTPAPVPDGILAQRLRDVFEKALSKVVGTCSYRNFAKCFPTPARNAPEQLKQLCAQMNEFYEMSMRAQFEAILKERNVIASLNDLDRLLKEADARRKAAPEGEVPVAPSMLPPNAVLGAHLTPLLLQAQEQVMGKIEAVRKSNDQMITTIEAQRREIEELVKALERNMIHMDGAVKEVQGVVGGRALMEELDAMQE